MSHREFMARLQREQLHDAAGKGDLAEVERLLQAKYPVNRFDTLGWTPLHHAVRGGHLHVVDRLLKAGANVNAHDERDIGNTPLADNVRECSFEMAKRLIDDGADPTIRGWMQLSALDQVMDRKDADAGKVQRLLKAAVEGRRSS
jgi:ankyrin repeat protein